MTCTNGDMMSDTITYEDIREYEKLFSMAPPFLLKRFAKRNSNLVSKFRSRIESHLGNINEDQKNKLDILLNTDIDTIQGLMSEAYQKSGLKQYEILANPKDKEFIELNIGEIRKIV